MPTFSRKQKNNDLNLDLKFDNVQPSRDEFEIKNFMIKRSSRPAIAFGKSTTEANS